VRNIVVRDYQNSNANGHAILEKVDEFIEQQFPETGEGTTSVKVCINFPNSHPQNFLTAYSRAVPRHVQG
jgi:hypothetical protein